MEKAALLMPVDRVIGRVQVQDDCARGLGPEGVEEEVDKHGLDRGGVMPDLVIARGGIDGRVFQPVERALARQRRRSGLIRLEAAQQGPEHRVGPQIVVVDQVLVAKRQTEDALPHQAPHPMGDEGRMAPIAKARGEPVNEPDGLIRRAEKQSPGRRSHAPAVERGHEFAAARPSERHPGRATLCGHRGAPSVWAQLGLTKQVLPVQRPRCTPVHERCGLNHV
jgi:hypothetical protein